MTRASLFVLVCGLLSGVARCAHLYQTADAVYSNVYDVAQADDIELAANRILKDNPLDYLDATTVPIPTSASTSASRSTTPMATTASTTGKDKNENVTLTSSSISSTTTALRNTNTTSLAGTSTTTLALTSLVPSTTSTGANLTSVTSTLTGTFISVGHVFFTSILTQFHQKPSKKKSR